MKERPFTEGAKPFSTIYKEIEALASKRSIPIRKARKLALGYIEVRLDALERSIALMSLLGEKIDKNSRKETARLEKALKEAHQGNFQLARQELLRQGSIFKAGKPGFRLDSMVENSLGDAFISLAEKLSVNTK